MERRQICSCTGVELQGCPQWLVQGYTKSKGITSLLGAAPFYFPRSFSPLNLLTEAGVSLSIIVLKTKQVPCKRVLRLTCIGRTSDLLVFVKTSKQISQVLLAGVDTRMMGHILESCSGGNGNSG